MIFLTIWIF